MARALVGQFLNAEHLRPERRADRRQEIVERSVQRPLLGRAPGGPDLSQVGEVTFDCRRQLRGRSAHRPGCRLTQRTYYCCIGSQSAAGGRRRVGEIGRSMWRRHPVATLAAGGVGLPERKISRERPDPGGVTEEHLPGRKTPVFRGVAPLPPPCTFSLYVGVVCFVWIWLIWKDLSGTGCKLKCDWGRKLELWSCLHLSCGISGVSSGLVPVVVGPQG